MIDDAQRYTDIWIVTIAYEGSDYWSDPAAFTTRDLAVAALERFHRKSPDVAPIAWYSIWAAEDHGENEDQRCPGWPLCDECYDWRGFVSGDPWYRLLRQRLFDGREGERFGHFSGVGLEADRVGYLWPLKTEED
jgi:hypothetical protein